MKTIIKTTGKHFLQVVLVAGLITSSSCKKELITNPVTPCNDINSETTWKNTSAAVDYTFDCTVSVNAKLTVEPGTVIEFNNGAGILVSSSGALKAIGTSALPIIMRGTSDIQGGWKGILVSSNNTENELTFCTIKNGGSSSFDGNTGFLANVRLSSTAQMRINNSVISKSAKYGVFVEGLDDSELEALTSIANDTFTENGSYPLSITAAMAKNITTGILIGLNQANKVEVRGGRMFGEHTWNNISVPYLITGNTSAGYSGTDGSLTVKPGTTLQFGADVGLTIGEYSNGYIDMTGNSSQHILISGSNPVPGSWKGICFQSTNAKNKLSYVDISYGGSSSFTGNTSQKGNIIVGGFSAGDVSVDHILIGLSKAYGIYSTLGSANIDITNNVSFQGNVSGDYYHEQ